MYVRVAQSVEHVTADHRLFHLESVAGSSPAVYFYFFNMFLFCFVFFFYYFFCLMYFIVFILNLFI